MSSVKRLTEATGGFFFGFRVKKLSCDGALDIPAWIQAYKIFASAFPTNCRSNKCYSGKRCSEMQALFIADVKEGRVVFLLFATSSNHLRFTEQESRSKTRGILEGFPASEFTESLELVLPLRLL